MRTSGRPRRESLRGGSIMVAAFVLELLATATTGVSAEPTDPFGNGVPWEGAPGVSESVQAIMTRQRGLEATRWKAGPARAAKLEFELEHDRRLTSRESPLVSRWPVSQAVEASAGLRSVPTVGLDFPGPRLGDTPGVVPPDSMGDVGPTQILVALNGFITVYDRGGNQGALGSYLDTFFESVRDGQTASDPHVRFDRLSQRWFVAAINFSPSNNRVLLAVSDGPTITGLSSFRFFQFRPQALPPGGNTARYSDFPTLGVDAKALYIGLIEFDLFHAPPRYLGSSAYVIRKSSLLGGGPLVVTAFHGVGNASSGMLVPAGVANDDPASAEGYFLGIDVAQTGQLLLRRVKSPGASPTLSAPIRLTVPQTSVPLNAPALGTSTRLSVNDDRICSAALHLNRLTSRRTLWAAHVIEVDANGVGKAGGGRTGSRWYEIEDLSGTPRLRQAGTLFDGAATAPRFFFYPSVAMSLQGHAFLGANSSGVGRFVEVAVTGRLASDALGAMRPVQIALTSTSPYDQTAANPQRWGDYSMTVVDPTDGMTAWTIQEYCNSRDSWGIRVFQLKPPPPATPVRVLPEQVQIGQASVDLTVVGNSLDGSGFFDPGPDPGGPGYPKRLGVSFSGGVQVRQVTFDSPTQIRVNVSTVGAAAGPQDLTVANPDGQSVVASGIVKTTVDPPPPLGPSGAWAWASLALIPLSLLFRRARASDANGRERRERTPS
jgi:hypothetical protein